MSLELTPTLSLLELALAVSCVVGLVLSIALAFDYALDVVSIDKDDPDAQRIRLAGVVGLRNSISLATVMLLFMVFVGIAALTPPSRFTFQQEVSAVLFEGMVIALSISAALNLRDRFRIRTGHHPNGRAGR